MSTTTQVTIWCDIEGCGHWFMGDSQQPVTEVRLRATRQRWKRERRSIHWVDICPLHDFVYGSLSERDKHLLYLDFQGKGAVDNE